MKKIIALTFSLLITLSLLSPSVSAVSSGYDIYYSDSVDWDKFRGQNITLNVYNWGEYISVDEGEEGDFDTNDEFERLTGIKVSYSNFSSNEEMYAKLKAGGNQYDIVIPSDYMIGRMINEGMLAKLNFDNIPNISTIDQKFLNPEYDPTGEYSVPYTWGLVGIIYNKTLVDPDDDVESWDILWNEKYANNILMFQNSRDSMGIALKRLGYSYNTSNLDEWDEAAESLKEQKPLVQAYVMDEIFDKMIGGEAALAPYYAGDAIVMMNDNPDLAFAVPREGTNVFVDAMCVLSTSNNKEAAELYINFMCETLTALKNCEAIGYSTPSSTVFALLDPDIQASVSYPSDDILNQGETYTALSSSVTRYVDGLWTDIMSVSGTNPWSVPIFMGCCVGACLGINVYRYKKKNKEIK